MAVDNGTFLRQTSTEMTRGLQNATKPNIVDRAFTPKTRRALKGTEPYRATSDTLARDLRSQAPGADPVFITGKMASLDWDMRSVKIGVDLTEEEIEDYRQYGTDPLKEWLETAIEYTDVGMENDCKTLLTDAAQNNVESVGTGWGDASSKPDEDIQDGIKTYAPGASLAIVGYGTALKLLRHNNLKASIQNFANSSSLPIGSDYMALRQWLESISGIPAKEIFIADKFYNSAAEGLSASLSYVFDDFFWAGHKRGVVLVEQSGSKRTTTKEEHGMHEIVFRRTFDQVRIDKNLGLHFTSV